MRINAAPAAAADLPEDSEVVFSWQGDTLLVAYREDTSPLTVLGAIATALGREQNAARDLRRADPEQ